MRMTENLATASRPGKRQRRVGSHAEAGAERRPKHAKVLVLARAVGAGLLLAASLPPWGWWPLAFPGLVMLDRLIADQPVWSRFRRGWLVAAALLFPTMSWLITFTAPGYVIAAAYYAGVFALACMACPPSAPGRWIALPGAWMLAEAWRGRWPFGGVPVSRLAMGQVDSPLVHVVRIGGSLLLDLMVVAVGVALAAAIARHWRFAVVTIVLVGLVVVWGGTSSKGHDIGSTRFALVQGGGPQGTRFFETDPSVVFQRHLEATNDVQQPVDVVLWPEDVVNIEGPVTNSAEGQSLSDIARRLDATLLVGVVEGDGDRFHNAQVAIDPDGNFIDRYEKVRRVPFGEYVPLRGLLRPFAGASLIERDALAGSGPAILRTPEGTFGVSESWEIFFPDRTRAAVRSGGEILLNPTNGASFRGSIVQTQQVAASRLAAISTGRWVLQAAPTGFSAIIDPDGTVGQRTAISERRVLQGDVQRRTGQTIATRVGDWLALILAIALVGLGWLIHLRSAGAMARNSRHRTAQTMGDGGGSGLEEDGDRAVVDQGHVHLGAEASGGDGRTEVAQPVDDRVDQGLGLFGPGGGDPRGSPAP
jgi:apolipoprotein N-acyltransferase